MRLLTSLTAVRISGDDARSFLQGQTSNDLQLLTPSASQLTSCNSAQGRVQAVLTLLERSDGFVAILPAAIVETLVTRLRKYILRSKVTIESGHNQWQLLAATAAQLNMQQLPIPQDLGAHAESGDISVLRWRDALERYIVLRPVGANTTITAIESPHADDEWQLAEIRAGLPQIFPETQDAFVAQMLNLDVLDGINFNKGCYTGQEIIARAHFRGAVKRRMFGFAANCASPAPGTRLLAAGTHAGEVVMAAATDNGCELLAVVHLGQREQALELEIHPGVPLLPRALPYTVPLGD